MVKILSGEIFAFVGVVPTNVSVYGMYPVMHAAFTLSLDYRGLLRSYIYS